MIILTKINRNYQKLYVTSKTYIYLFNKYRNFILNDFNYHYYFDYYYEYKKFKDYYIRYCYKYNKLLFISYFNYSGKTHRENSPAWIKYDKNGQINEEKYFLYGNLHRENGPALINYNKNGRIYKKQYYLNNKEYSYKDYLLEIKKLI